MKKYFFAFFTFVVVIACNKDKFQTKPTIKINSFNNSTVDLGNTLKVSLEVTDKEGDVEDSLFVVRERLNTRAPSPRILSPVLRYKIPAFPDKSKVEMEVDIPYSTGLTLNSSPISIPGDPNHKEPDTLNLKFFVRDKGKNVSDTVNKGVIVIR